MQDEQLLTALGNKQTRNMYRETVALEGSEFHLHMIRYAGISGHITVPTNRGVFRILDVISVNIINVYIQGMVTR
jgi:hypothetical protein